MSDHYDNPLKWLLYELPAYIEPAPLAALMARYEANKKAYYQQVRIAHAERIVKVYTRRGNPGDAQTIARWQAKLDKLKEDLL